MTYDEFYKTALLEYEASSCSKISYQSFVAKWTNKAYTICILISYKPNLKNIFNRIVLDIDKAKISVEENSEEEFIKLYCEAMKFRDFLVRIKA